MAAKLCTMKHLDRILLKRPPSCSTLCHRVHNVAEPWKYEEEVPTKMRMVAGEFSLDMHGFNGNYKKHPAAFKSKLKRNKYQLKISEARVRTSTALRDLKLLDRVNQKRSKSNMRKVRKSIIKESKPDDITSDEANKYLELLHRIRDGIKSPKSTKIKKYLPNVAINKPQIKHYLKQIKQLNICNVMTIDKQSKLPSKSTIDAQYNALNNIYNEISAINQSEDHEVSNTLLHLDLYTKLLLSYGKIGRTHRMMYIYKELKQHNLQIRNDTMIIMLDVVHKHGQFTTQLWTEYLNDFRKGKIPERPTLALFNALIRNHSEIETGEYIFESSTLFRMMTEEFKIAPDSETMLHLLTSYKTASPPRYKSAQKLIERMRNEYNITPTTAHYAIVLSTISTKWSHFNWQYKDLEQVDDEYLKYFQNGVDLQRCLKVFNTVLQNKTLTLDSGILCAILKACRHANIVHKRKMPACDALFRKYVLLEMSEEDKNEIDDERFQEISELSISSHVLSELMLTCFLCKDFQKAQRYYEICTNDERIKDRFVIDCDLFCNLIHGITCDLKGKTNCESIVMERIEWIESEMIKYDLISNMQIWKNWFIMAKRLRIPHVTTHLFEKMDEFQEQIKYFELDFGLLQSVIDALYNNHNMNKALDYYGKYYKDIQLFSHFDLKLTGQKEIDFHGFRSGFACVAIHWILENEYPPLNISKYLLEKYGSTNPDVTVVIGQGHHSMRGTSSLYNAITQHIASLSPNIEVTKYPSNPGQIMLNGDQVVAWRKYHGHQVDVLKVNDNLQMRLYI